MIKRNLIIFAITFFALITFAGYGQTDTTATNYKEINSGILDLITMALNYFGIGGKEMALIMAILGFIIRLIERKWMKGKFVTQINTAIAQAETVTPMAETHKNIFQKLIDKIEKKKPTTPPER